MADHSKIEWTDATFNPWVGCTQVSAACDHCYAESWAKRIGHPELWKGEHRRTSKAYWLQPLKWDKKAFADGVRRKVFCASLADVFDNQVPLSWRNDLWRLIERTPSLDWQLLTKRPQNIARMLPNPELSKPWGRGWPNVWLGTTTENQDEANRRIPALFKVEAVVYFISAEPLLGAIDLTNLDHLGTLHRDGIHGISAIWKGNPIGRACLDWVITGGETGPHARPTHPNWTRLIRDQCRAAGVAYFHKQNGEWLDADAVAGPQQGQALPLNYDEAARLANGRKYEHHSNGTTLIRVGKKRAGRLLDGELHDGMPA